MGQSKGNDKYYFLDLFHPQKTDTKGFRASSAKERERLEILLNQCYTEQFEKELDCILKRQKELLLKKSQGHRIRARISHFE